MMDVAKAVEQDTCPDPGDQPDDPSFKFEDEGVRSSDGFHTYHKMLRHKHDIFREKDFVLLSYEPAPGEEPVQVNELNTDEALAQITTMWHCNLHNYNYVQVLWLYKTTDLPQDLKHLEEIEEQSMICSDVVYEERDIIFACSIVGKCLKLSHVPHRRDPAYRHIRVNGVVKIRDDGFRLKNRAKDMFYLLVPEQQESTGDSGEEDEEETELAAEAQGRARDDKKGVPARSQGGKRKAQSPEPGEAGRRSGKAGKVTAAAASSAAPSGRRRGEGGAEARERARKGRNGGKEAARVQRRPRRREDEEDEEEEEEEDDDDDDEEDGLGGGRARTRHRFLHEYDQGEDEDEDEDEDEEDGLSGGRTQGRVRIGGREVDIGELSAKEQVELGDKAFEELLQDIEREQQQKGEKATATE